MLKNIFQIYKSLTVFLYEYLWFYFNYTTHIDFIKNVVLKLSKINILYVKFFQWVTTDTIYKNETLQNVFINFSKNVEYCEDDIDYLSLLTLVNNKQISLESITPINSGTISLVYKAIFNDQPVIIKLLKKNIHQRLVDSISFFKLLTKISSYIPSICHFNLEKIVNENSQSLLEQNDFLQEVKNNENFKDKFLDNSNIIIPTTYKEFTISNNNIIIMDYISGENVYSLSDDEKCIFSDLLYDFIIECLFEQNIFHGDLHIGNILFVKEHIDNETLYKIGVIDYGIVNYFDNNIKELLFNFFLNLFERGDNKNLFNFIINNLTEEIDKSKTMVYDKQDVLNSLLLCKEKYNILNSYGTLQSSDIYYINQTLSQYNLTMSLQFSKILISISCMYSLITLLRKNDTELRFENAFYRYVLNKITY